MNQVEKSKGKIGIFICHCGGNISDVVNVDELSKFLSELENVVVYDYRFMCSNDGQKIIREKIREDGLGGMVVACCTPKMYEEMFRRVAQEAGLNQFLVEIANIREQCSYPHWYEPEKATEKAKYIVKSQVEKVRFLESLECIEAEIHPGVAVIGAGVAGMHAALQLADMGHKVHLIEKSPTIGGNMARLVKTFPTDDCATCTLGPIMNEVYAHENIELLTCSEVTEAKRSPGKVTLKVRKYPRFVTEDCVGCNRCSEKCPVSVPSEWDAGIADRKAIYLSSQGAVPKIWTIDPENCFYFKWLAKGKKDKCMLCKEVCPTDAVDFEMQPEDLTVDVGSVIIATGFKPYDPTPMSFYNYGRDPDVRTQLQVARMLDLLSPTKGKVLKSDGNPAKSIVFVQCVGSRSEKEEYGAHPYCSRVCCMAAVKHASLIKKYDKDVEIYIMYNDLRASGKGYEEYYTEALVQGVNFIRGLPGEVIREGDKLVVPVHDASTDKFLKVKADVVVLSEALEPNDIDSLLKNLGVDKSPDGFVKELHPKIGPVETQVNNVFVAGCAQGPKDITESIAQAGAAALMAAKFIGKGTMILSPLIATVSEDLCRSCDRCEKACEYEAIRVNDKLIAEVDETACLGCGRCAVVCPTGAIQIKGFKTAQLLAQLEGLTT
jgi:heterodisulfide reductase subunit A